MSFTVAIEKDENLPIYELSVSEYVDDVCRFILNREELWKLKQEVDRLWFAGEVTE